MPEFFRYNPIINTVCFRLLGVITLSVQHYYLINAVYVVAVD